MFYEQVMVLGFRFQQLEFPSATILERWILHVWSQLLSYSLWLHIRQSKKILAPIFASSTLAQKNLFKLRFICAASSTSLTEVSKWLSSFYKAIFPMVNDLWVSKHRKVHVPFGSHWILNDSTGVLDVTKLKLLRLEVQQASPLLWQLFDFSALYIKIDLTNLKAWMKVLTNKMFNCMVNLCHFKFSLVQRTTLNFRNK